MKLLLYEDCWNGFLSAVFEAFLPQNRGCFLMREARGRAAAALYEAQTVATDAAKSRRVTAGILRLSAKTGGAMKLPPTGRPMGGSEVDFNLEQAIYRAWLSELHEIESNIVAMLKTGFEQDLNPLTMRHLDHVAAVNKASWRAGGEAHRFTGFVRFEQISDDTFGAKIRPEYNILPLIGEHFADRFNNQKIIIHDVNRDLAIFAYGGKWRIAELERGSELFSLSRNGEYENLFRAYFNAIANPARKNLKLQQACVPLKYREFLPEFKM